MLFGYHRRLAPMLGMLLTIALAETLSVHLVAMALWGRTVALALGGVDLLALVLLIALLRSLRRRPIELGEGVLRLRTGMRMTLDVPLSHIAGFRAGWSAADLKDRSLLNMALLAWPSVVIDLARPVRRRRRVIRAVAHCVDDPALFRAAVERAVADHACGASAA